jgi:cytoskeletal protein RodZ
MDPADRHERRRQALRHLQAQRLRVKQLRARAIAVSLIAFVGLWGIVFAQMATGNDPVLARRQAPAVAVKSDAGSDAGDAASAGLAAGAATETTDPEEVETELSETEPLEAETAAPEPEPEPEPVVTSQS